MRKVKCMKYIRRFKITGERLALVACASGVVLVSASCSHRPSPDTYGNQSQEESHFHADNDIAMTVRSIVDAVRVGETLLPADYDFEGILTDGQGTPLYTDVAGMPGEWSVKVESGDEVSISNRYLGDLMYEDLRVYILSALDMNEADLVSAYNNPLNEAEFIYHYDTGEIDINFSILPTSTSSGLEGTLMTISISRRS